MESIHNKTGRVFTGKFAETAVKLGLATAKGEEKPKAVKKPVKKTKKAKK